MRHQWEKNINKERQKWKIKQTGTKRYQASVTIEATYVMSIILFCISILLSQAYRLHDTVTGAMILEEVLIQAGMFCDVEGIQLFESEDADATIRELEQYGEQMGNPRLWLGNYEIHADVKKNHVSGSAKAGNWELEMEIGQFRPGHFLNMYESLKEMGKEPADDGS